MKAYQAIYQQFLNGKFALMTDFDVAKRIGLKKSEIPALRDILHDLCREGKLMHDSSFRYGTPEQFGAKKGTISGNERGFGFFMPEDGSGDLFIPHRALNGALHGDTVYAVPVHRGRSDDEGEVLAILERGYVEIVGTYVGDGIHAGYLHPDERKFAEDIFIPLPKSKKCKTGMKAVARITSYPEGRAPGGEIVEILGSGDDFFVEELSLIRAHKLREEFPEDVLAVAKRLDGATVSPEETVGRVDLRGELIITVDGEDTRDIDDAISIKKTGENFELGVHIADVTHYVKRGSVLDDEALKRGTSVYFPDRVLPMLPRELSNGICSLNEGVDRLALSCFMTVDRSGHVVSRSVAPSVIHSTHRMTYTDVTAIANGDSETIAKYSDLVEFVATAVELTNVLKEMRKARGSVSLDVKEAKILYRDGEIEIPDHERTISHEMIEQFMVLANESVATLMTEKKMPFVYRIHEKPSVEKAEGLKLFLIESGVSATFDPEELTPYDYQELLSSIEGSPMYSVVNRVMLRSMMKAKYSPTNVGHFGLASECYCHFTSPIRRYPDLTIHRIIKDSLRLPEEEVRKSYEKFVSVSAQRSSDCEKNAVEAERDVDALYMVAYMADRIGEEYDAVISGVTSFGVFAELSNTIEGFIPVETLKGDYEFIEDRGLLKGRRTSFRLGERIHVRVDSVNYDTHRTHFAYLNHIKED